MHPRDLVPAFADAVARLEREAPYASAYARRDSGTAVRVDSLSVAAEPVAPNAGFTLSAWTGERFLEDSRDELSPEAVAASAEALRARVRAAGVRRDGLALDPGPALERAFAQPMRIDSRTVPV